MIIALIVLSSILLILILGLIFNKEFRVDVLKASSDNQAEFKGFKIRGALFWVIYALTAVGTIYIATQYQEREDSSCDPILSAVDTKQWLALDINRAKPAVLKYGCESEAKLEDHSQKSINMDLKLNDEFDVVGLTSNYSFGNLDMQSLKELHLTNDLKADKYVEIYYDLQLNPFKSSKKNVDFYDWNEYENLPFIISVKFSQERQVHVMIKSKDDPPKFKEKYLSLDKWDAHIPINQEHYVVRLRSRDLDKDNKIDEHANFEIIKFSGKIIQNGS